MIKVLIKTNLSRKGEQKFYVMEEIKEKINNNTYKLLKNTKSKSIVWNVFYNIQKDDGSVLEDRVYCELCSNIYKWSKGQISNLLKHKCVHSIPSSSSPIISDSDKSACFDSFLNFVIEDCRPFSIVEGSGFRKIIEKFIQIGAKYGSDINLDDLIPSGNTLSKKCKEIAEEKKLSVKPNIKKLVENREASVTIDLWTDNFIKRNFLCATLHFHLNYKLSEIILGMKSMDFMSSSAANVQKKLEVLLEEFGVTNLSNIVFVTDRGSNVKSALKDYERLNCSAHLFSNILNESFEATDQLKIVTESCKKIVKYFKKSNKQHLLNTTLKSNCPTRWNSNYVMLKSVLDNYGKVSEILADDTEKRCLLNFSMSLLQSLVDLCNNFEKIFKKLQGSNYPTLCFVIPSINKVKEICNVEGNEEEGIIAFKTNLLLKLDKWKNNLNVMHKVAVFLYPPGKYLIENDFESVKQFCIDAITKDIEALNGPNNNHPQKDIGTSISLITTEISDCMSSENTETSVAELSFFFPNRDMNISSQVCSANIRSEVDQYANEYVCLTECVEVMVWWKVNACKYPNLSKLALKVLSIPASSAASERVFSMAGNIITEKRNRIQPKTVDSILFLNSLYKKSLW